MGDFNCVQLGLVPILAIGIPHCKTCTVVSTAAWMSSKEHTADTDYRNKPMNTFNFPLSSYQSFSLIQIHVFPNYKITLKFTI